MRRERRPARPKRLAAAAAVAAVIGLVGAGCAALSGLDALSEQACAPDCDGGRAIDGAPVLDSGDSATSAGQDSALVPIDGEAADVYREASGGEGGGRDSGTAADAPFESSTEVDTGAPDTGFDTGCGPLDAIDNCSACGAQCMPDAGKDTQCNGVTCSYACEVDTLDCNQSIAPDLDGCECSARGATQSQCCGTGCPQSHSYDTDLTTSTFYDCVAPGAFNSTVAKDACNAYAGPSDGGLCDIGFTFTCRGLDGGVISDMVCSNLYAGPCACWAYDGTQSGHMHIGSASGTASLANCLCPSTVDPSWN
jgi:hypothetical protein